MMVRNITGFIAVLCLTFIFYNVTSPANAQNSLTNQGTGVTYQRYTHPTKGFALNFPSNAELVEREAPVDISINSKSGWGMTVQSSATNPGLTLNDLAARLEAHYLGKQKPWSQKITGSHVLFKQFKAYDAMYEGSGMRVRVLIIRTPAFDFVLMFITPAEIFISVKPVIDTILSSFQPIAIARPAPDVTPPSAPVQAASPQMDYLKVHEASLGYSIKYPESWQIGKPDDYTLVIAGPKQGRAAEAAVTIQNVASPVEAPPEQRAQAVLQQLRTQMAYGIPNVRHVGGGSVVVAGIQGLQLVSDFNRVSIPYRQWTIVLPHPSGTVVHIWTYTAPLDRFNEFRDITETMINSWRMEIVPQ